MRDLLEGAPLELVDLTIPGAVDSSPGELAAVDGSQQLTYPELRERSVVAGARARRARGAAGRPGRADHDEPARVPDRLRRSVPGRGDRHPAEHSPHASRARAAAGAQRCLARHRRGGVPGTGASGTRSPASSRSCQASMTSSRSMRLPRSSSSGARSRYPASAATTRRCSSTRRVRPAHRRGACTPTARSSTTR